MAAGAGALDDDAAPPLFTLPFALMTSGFSGFMLSINVSTGTAEAGGGNVFSAVFSSG